MNFFSKIAVLLGVLILYFSKVKPAGVHQHVTHCHVKHHNNLHLLAGETITLSDHCQLIKCIDPENEEMDVETCPLPLLQVGCKLRTKSTGDFPDCCPEITC